MTQGVALGWDGGAPLALVWCRLLWWQDWKVDSSASEKQVAQLRSE
jgi:hypothetical protein